MWQGQQPSGNEPRQQPPSANPYLRPAPWDAPTVTAGPGGGPNGGPGGDGDSGSGGGGEEGGGDRRRTMVVALVAVAAVLMTAGVTGWLVLGRDSGEDGTRKDEATDVSPSPSGPPARSSGEPKPVVAGWKTVVNPKTGIAFDVPPEWDRKAATWASYAVEGGDEEKILVGFAAPAVLKEKWCASDDNKDGVDEDTALASAGSRSENSAKDVAEAARKNAELWVYGRYAQPDRTKISNGPVASYTTASGIKGSLATSESSGADRSGKCDTDGKATAFAFKNSKGDFVSWTFHGAKGVDDEVPDATVREILGTVRLTDGTTGS
ncbi:hypothetical protein [Streptomyces corynorhini]|uniref:DUF8017 domain-containing protein n=1 Tax=Streptomyces corynorhini TaxID=2282652 RepID=A0A370BAD2_9ACTN|nr:hypothetical protein [Streptomyces corynorhini]RDG38591.1 hypothetical protein DVH02_08380 [Streptomyces corynorhini]